MYLANKNNGYPKYVGGGPPVYPGALEIGNSNREGTKLLQEYLTLAGYHLVLDGLFGHATAQAIYKYSFEVLGAGYRTTVLTKYVWRKLTANMTFALSSRYDARKVSDINDLVVTFAKRHLKAKAMELNMRNEGPWVRLYMQDHEGPKFPWCAGFVSFILQQALETQCRDLGDIDFEYLYSCDLLAAWGNARHALFQHITPKTHVPPGSIFLVYRGHGDWVHTGIVINKRDNCLETIEGNTNMAGVREGTAVLHRFRSFKKIHVITDYAADIEITRPRTIRSTHR